MRKLIAGILLSLFFSSSIFASLVTKEIAQKVAINWYAENDQSLKKYASSESETNITNSYEFRGENETLLYIFNLTGDGYILVPADNSVRPVLGYSDTQNFNPDNVPPALLELIESYKEQIQYLKDKKSIADPKTEQLWDALSSDNISSSLSEVSQEQSVVGPLLTTTWNQGTYYNAECPVDYRGPDGHTVVGCMATAMGQMMNYHQYPPKGYGTNYYPTAHGLVTEDFNSTYFNWNNMTDSLSDYNDDVATLLFLCGVSCNMNYGYAASFSIDAALMMGMKKNFGYSGEITFANRDWTYGSSEKWLNILKSELDDFRPVFYAADNTVSGHIWVVDGYDSENLFHCNWGWGGLYDGYFSLENLAPGGVDFSNNPTVIYNVKPSSDVIDHDVTWNGTHNITGNTTITENAKVTLLPGTIVNLSDSYLIDIHGSISATGTETDSIVFISPESGPGWKGIKFNGPLADSSYFKYCRFENAKFENIYSVPDWVGNGTALRLSKVNNVEIENCSFINNSNYITPEVGNSGGAIYIESCSADRSNVKIKNCEFVNNKSMWGIINIGLFSTATIEHCTFEDNLGVIIKQNSPDTSTQAKILNCFFKNNDGLSISLGDGNHTVSGNLIIDNNFNFVDCGQYRQASAILDEAYYTQSRMNIFNNTILNNYTSHNEGAAIYKWFSGGQLELKNNIIRNNTNSTDNRQIWVNDGTIDLSYCNIEGGISKIVGTATTENITNIDPQFLLSSPNQYQLSPYSPCINAGDPATTLEQLGESTDILGNPRIIGGRIDIGAYEDVLGEPVMDIEVQDLQISENEDTVHLVSHQPLITFKYYNQYDLPQDHYQIELSTLPDFSAVDIWDTGIVSSNDTSVTYAGSPLENGNTYYLRVRAGCLDFWSDWSDLEFRMNSTPTVPILIAPIDNNVVSSQPILKILPSTDGENDDISYSFYFYNSSELSNALDSAANISGGTDTVQWSPAVTLDDNQQYWWRVKSFDGYEYSNFSETGSFIFNIQNDTPAEFTLTSPLESVQVSTLKPTLTWNSAYDPDPLDTVSYTVYLDTPKPGIVKYDANKDIVFMLPEDLSDNSTYYWKVVATDLNGATRENTGGYQSFTVNTANEYPGDFALLAPKNSAMVTDLTPDFIWESSMDPDILASSAVPSNNKNNDITVAKVKSTVVETYQFYLSNDSTFATTTSVEVTGTTYTPTTELTEDAVYYWKVTAMDSDSAITSSTRWSFWTNHENSVPDAFACNEADVDSMTATLSWQPSRDNDLNDMLNYTVFLGKDLESLTAISQGPDTSFNKVNLEDNSTYFWGVVATDLSGATRENSGGYHSFIINIGNNNPTMPSLSSPDSVIVLSLKPIFKWEASTDPDPNDSITYKMLVWNEAFNDSSTVDSNKCVLPQPLIDNSSYSWYVKAMDNHSGYSISQTVPFWTDLFPEPPAPFNTISPVNGQVFESTIVDLLWNNSKDPDPIDYLSYTLKYKSINQDSTIWHEVEIGEDTTYSLDLVLGNRYEWKVIAKDDDGFEVISDSSNLRTFDVGSVSQIATGIPEDYSLEQNFPNPFNPTTTIDYAIPEQSDVKLMIINLMGRKIKQWSISSQQAGWHEIVWDGTNMHGNVVSTGVYIYSLKAGDFVDTKKMVFMK